MSNDTHRGISNRKAGTQQVRGLAQHQEIHSVRVSRPEPPEFLKKLVWTPEEEKFFREKNTIEGFLGGREGYPEGYAGRTEGTNYLVRIGEAGYGKGASPWGDHLFSDLDEAISYAENIQRIELAEVARGSRAIPHQWKGGSVSRFEAIKIFKVPPDTAYWQGVVASQEEWATVFARVLPWMSHEDLLRIAEIAKTLPGGGPQVIIYSADKLEPIDWEVRVQPGGGKASSAYKAESEDARMIASQGRTESIGETVSGGLEELVGEQIAKRANESRATSPRQRGTPGTTEAVVSTAYSVLESLLSQAALSKDVKERRKKTGYASLSSDYDANENRAEKAFRYIFGFQGKASLEERLDIGLYRQHLRELANRTKPGDTLEVRLPIREKGLHRGDFGTLYYNYREVRVIYKKYPYNPYHPESGQWLDIKIYDWPSNAAIQYVPDLDRIIDPKRSDFEILTYIGIFDPNWA